ncbi:hypothetical protein CEE69_11235 [Rhodopirellula bahusiensis]|uniref:Uncharacterized protein n=1 Tax=Rhodopirellula bahusiensis TaxID=2014065 RepID=A0A2G1W7L3_9BACT|nr:hypothetical protein CEE69_11235 [Rhodopirellula bahusiensis]
MFVMRVTTHWRNLPLARSNAFDFLYSNGWKSDFPPRAVNTVPMQDCNSGLDGDEIDLRRIP